MRVSKRIPEKAGARLKRIFMQEQNGACALCDCQMSEDWPQTKTTATWDHIVPKSKGGGHTIRNLILMCEACNVAKKADPLPFEKMGRILTTQRRVERAFRESYPNSALVGLMRRWG